VDEPCPVCGEASTGSGEHCPKCGFPRILFDRLGGPVAASDPPVEADPPTLASGRGALLARPELPPEAELNASLAHALEERTELLRTLDQDAPDVTAELCEAALNESSGRAGDAQQILRSAQGRLDRETEELLGRHLADLEARGRALQSSGLRVTLDDELAHLAEEFVGGDPAGSIAGLLSVERRLARLETHWRGLQGLIGQVTTLQREAAALGIDVELSPDRLGSARATLATVPATEHEVDLAAQVAAETLMKLHEKIPPDLEAELARHGEALAGAPTHLNRAQSARKLHADATRHLREGRLVDAVQSVSELRAELRALAEESRRAPTPSPDVSAPEPAAIEPAPEPEPPRAVAPTPTPVVPAIAPPPPTSALDPADPRALASLMQKARTLAAKVRSLPADSPQAQTAAREIHEATDLLRARRFAEADDALTRLMRSLAVEGPRT
jgi:hypothetical protein